MYLNLASSKNRNKGRIFIGVLIIFLISALGIRQPETVYGAEREKTERAFVGVPVLMYHHLTQEDGDAKGVTITQDRFRADMKYLERNDYTPLLPTDLSAIAAGEQAMPQRPIIITFDDGYESNYRLGFPVLKETGMKATIFVITEAMNTQRQGQIPKLTWVQMKEMYDSGFVDIQTHSHDLHNSENQGEFKRFDINGIQRTSTENQTQYDSRVGSDFENSIHLIEKNVGNDVMAISYPFGV
ncbi:MAG: polysaccharide deacetylase family protein, partial [Anaerovorax sp.]